jgi:hypothetical protein
LLGAQLLTLSSAGKKTDHPLIIAFRGSTNSGDWMTNCDIISREDFNGKFHSGFYMRANKIPSQWLLQQVRFCFSF